MTGRQFRVDWRPDDTPEALRAAYLAEQDIMLRTRLNALWLLRCGRRMGEVASVVDVHYRTIQRWVSWYRTGGVGEVLSHRMGSDGQPRFLSADRERELTEEVGSGRFRTGGEIREFIESEYRVSFQFGSVYTLLPRLGCSPGAPRGLHEKADLRAQESWKRRDSAMRSGGAGVSRETVLGLADEMRVGLRGTVRRVWGRRGVKVRQRVQIVYEWMYMFCVVDGRRGEVTVGLDRFDEVGSDSGGGQWTEAWDRGGGAGVGRRAWSPQSPC